MFGAIVGGSSTEERRRCAQEVASRNVSGFSNFSINLSVNKIQSLHG